MKIREIPYSWIKEEEHRIDCGPFTRGGIEAKKLIQAASFDREPLVSLTRGGLSGMYHVGMDKLRWVEGPEHGVPFLRSADILKADLSHQPYILRAQARNNALFMCPAGTTLITRSGTIGRMAYCRSDMAEMAMSQDVLKVVPDQAKVRPGYLFAFLASKYGVPLVVSGTFGSIIVHIEAENIADLPVPRLGDSLERQVHQLVEEAAEKRTRSARMLRDVAARFDELIRDVDLSQPSPRINTVPASTIQVRFDAQFHDPVVARIRECITSNPHTTIREMCNRVFLPGIFKRIHIEDPSYGAPYFTGASLFWLEPLPKGILSRKTTLFDQVRMEEGTILVQAFGQDGGLTGRSVWVGRNLHGSTTTHMLVRLNTASLKRSAYLFGFLQSDAAYRQIACLTYGGSIPHFDERWISTVLVPLLPNEDQIGSDVLAALNDRDSALEREREARALVERAIEEAS